MSIRFEILGPMRVTAGGGEIAVRAARERTILAVLLLHANDLVPAQQLIEAVWQSRPLRAARTQLQGCVSRLRQQLTDAGGEPHLVLTDQTGYRLRATPSTLDTLEFRRLRAEARATAAAGRDCEARERYRAALALWRGPVLAGVDSELVRQAAGVLAEERAQALEERIQVELALGEDRELVGELTSLVREHPFREALHGALMLALYRVGRQADALAAYRRIEQVLHDDLGTEPGPDLQRLHRAMLARDPTLAARPAVSSPPAVSPAPTPHELPADVAGFTGRADAVAALDKLLPHEAGSRPGPVVIAAITGTAGVGKTALAVHWAHRVADRFPDGQLYLNLRGYASRAPLQPLEALVAMLRSLGVPVDQIPTDEAQAASLCRTLLADRRVLLVLDNAGSAEQVRPLLPGSPGCLVLVTSRDRLTGLVARDGAHRLQLDVLTTGEAGNLLRRLLGPQRVAAEPAAAAELAKACACLPLALRITAAHIAERPERTIAAHVAQLTTGDRLAALRADDDEASSVLVAFDLSYRSLASETARLFGLLGLVPGPDITPAAAAALAGGTSAEAGGQLRRLASAHLVEEHLEGRYTFHDLLRSYAGRLATSELSGPERDAATGRLLGYYLQAADAAAGLLYPEMLRLTAPATERVRELVDFGTPAQALAWLDDERANLIAAIGYAAGNRIGRAAWLLAECLRGYFWRGKHTVDWHAAATAALAAAEDAADLQAQAAGRRSLADLNLNLDRYDEAIEDYREAAELARRAGWGEGEAAVLTNLGMVFHYAGRLPEAAEHYSRALALERRGGRLDGQAVNSGNLGRVNHERGRLAEAREQIADALSMYRELRSVGGEADALTNLGEVCHDLGELDAAVDHLTRAGQLHERMGDSSGVASALVSLAAVLTDADRLAEAVEKAAAGERLASTIELRRIEARAWIVLAAIDLRRGQPERAQRLHRDALDRARETETRSTEIDALLGLAEVYGHTGRHGEAWEHAVQALDLAGEAGYRVAEGRALTTLAGLRYRQGRYDEARDHAERALRSHRETGHRPGETRTVTLLAKIDSVAASEDG
jgi:DNA-binding SARP family transcriptional activator/Tfp pilus assembly protein PilF